MTHSPNWQVRTTDKVWNLSSGHLRISSCRVAVIKDQWSIMLIMHMTLCWDPYPKAELQTSPASSRTLPSAVPHGSGGSCAHCRKRVCPLILSMNADRNQHSGHELQVVGCASLDDT